MSKLIRTVAEIIDAAYTKAELVLLLPAVSKLYANYGKLLESEKVIPPKLEYSKNMKAENKSTIALYCAAAFATAKTYEAFRACLPENTRKIWNALIWNNLLSNLDLENDFGITAYKIQKSEYITYRTESYPLPLPDFEFLVNQRISPFDSRRLHRSEKLFFSLPIQLRQWLIQFHDFPEDGNLTPALKMEPTEYVFTSGETQIMLEWPRIMAYQTQGMIPITAKRRPSQSSFVKIQRNLSIREFFAGAEEKKLQTHRTAMLTTLALHAIHPSFSENMPDAIKNLFEETYCKYAHSVPVALPDHKGMATIENWDLYRPEKTLLELLAQLPKGEWVPFQNVEKFVLYNFVDIRPMTVYTATNKLYFEYVEADGFSFNQKHYIESTDYRKAIEKPFLRGSFFLFAAFGLCDIAFDKPDLDKLGQTCYSSFDGLKYVRRTALGDFVCGISKNYKPPRNESAGRYVLSPDTLLIHVESDSPSGAALLEPYAERIGTNRFRCDAQIFLKSVRSKKDLESKIELFKHLVDTELPPNWGEFFLDLIHKINPLEAAQPCRVMKIPQDNKALIRLFAQDTVLKSLAIKAEGYHLIIPESSYNAVKRRLQEFGYLLT